MDRHTAVAAGAKPVQCLCGTAPSPDTRLLRLELLIADLLIENERLRQALAVTEWESLD